MIGGLRTKLPSKLDTSHKGLDHQKLNIRRAYLQVFRKEGRKNQIEGPREMAHGTVSIWKATVRRVTSIKRESGGVPGAKFQSSLALNDETEGGKFKQV